MTRALKQTVTLTENTKITVTSKEDVETFLMDRTK